MPVRVDWFFTTDVINLADLHMYFHTTSIDPFLQSMYLVAVVHIVLSGPEG